MHYRISKCSEVASEQGVNEVKMGAALNVEV